MKITKTRLKQLIQEELENFDVLGEQDEAPKTAADVELITKTLDRVNNKAEAQQLLNKVIGHIKATGNAYGMNAQALRNILMNQIKSLQQGAPTSPDTGYEDEG